MVSIRRAGAADVDAACAVVTDAFADYPFTRWTVDADRHTERLEALQRLCMTQLVLPYGEAWIACADSGTVLSVAMWMLPGPDVPLGVSEAVAAASATLEGARHDASVTA